MVIAETAAAIALVKGSVEGVKAVIDTCKDISEVSHHLDDLFKGHDQVKLKHQQQTKTKKPEGKWQAYIKARFGDQESEPDGTSFGEIAQEVIEAEQLKKEMYRMRVLLNQRFGPDTWSKIIETRNKRIKEYHRQQAEEKIAYESAVKASREKWHRIMVTGLQVLFLVSMVGLIALFLMWASTANISQLR